MKLAHDIQAAIAALDMRHVQAQATDCVTVSMGVAVVMPGELASGPQLLARADARLYRAKRSGRNRLVSSD